MSVLHEGPFLRRVLDGRRSPIPLLQPVAYVYLALMLGIVPTAVVAAVSFIAVRRFWLFWLAVLVGVVGFATPGVVLAVWTDVTENLALAILVMRLVAVALGYLLYRAMNGPVRGHMVLQGNTVSLLMAILPAFAWQLLAPWSIRVWAELPLIALAMGVAS